MSADSDVKEALRLLCGGLPVNPVPPPRHRDETLPHAPTRTPVLNAHQQKVRGTLCVRMSLSAAAAGQKFMIRMMIMMMMMMRLMT